MRTVSPLQGYVNMRKISGAELGAEGVKLPRVFGEGVGYLWKEFKAVLERRPVNGAGPASAQVVANVGEHLVVRELVWDADPFVRVTQQPANGADHGTCNLQRGGGVAREKEARLINREQRATPPRLQRMPE